MDSTIVEAIANELNTLNGLERWLNNKPANEIVGSARCSDDCVLHRYFEVRFPRLPVADLLVTNDRILVGEVAITHTALSQTFVRRVDDGLGRLHPVIAAGARQGLRDARRDCEVNNLMPVGGAA